MVRQLWDKLMATEIMLVCDDLSTGENVKCKQCGQTFSQVAITRSTNEGEQHRGDD